jgi:3-deoxy-D-manno-octulosonate 8-phosphate phosphatase (KDO 8-P phosphatase)
VLDVDGVLTDGRIAYDAYGPAGERQFFHVHDGIALRWLQRAGVAVAWISGRGCPATEARAHELEIEELHTKVESKRAVLEDIQARRGVGVPETVAMGDDLPDLALVSCVELFAAPADARPEVRARAHWVSASRGGAGAVRDLCERILRAKGRWNDILDAAVR